MIAGLLVVVFILVFILFVYFEVVGFNKSRLQRRLEPVESIEFQSRALRGKLSWTSSLPRLSQGYLIVTDRRVLFGVWILPPVWEAVKVILLKDIDDVSRSKFPFGQTQVSISARGHKVAVVPRKRRIRPVGDLSAEFVEAINRGRPVHA